jgi:hypothetical protein
MATREPFLRDIVPRLLCPTMAPEISNLLSNMHYNLSVNTLVLILSSLFLLYYAPIPYDADPYKAFNSAALSMSYFTPNF